MTRSSIIVSGCILMQAAGVAAQEPRSESSANAPAMLTIAAEPPPSDSRMFALSYGDKDVVANHSLRGLDTWSSVQLAQADGDAPVETPAEAADMPAEGEDEELLSLIELPDYTGDLSSRAFLTGDWGGARTELAENGILFQFDLVQFFQHNAYGGRNTSGAARYSGSIDYIIKFDTARMGLWPAGLLMLKGETQFGRSVNPDVGSLMAPNADALFPIPNDPGATTLTDVVFTQFISENLGFALGKIDFRGGDQNVFAHDETTQFMNLALMANPALIHMVPYSALNATVFVRPAEWIVGAVGVLDSYGRPDTPGFDTAFHSPQGTSFMTEWTFNIKPFGLVGHQRAGAVYSNREFTALDQNPRFQFAPLNIVSFLLNPETESDDWGFYYNFDQYLYTEPDDPEQGVGVFGRFGWTTGEANPIAQFYSFGLGGQGVVPKRDKDTFGLGYYYINFSDNLPSLLDVSSEQGVEFFYNIEVTPWLHITPDIQFIIDPALADRDLAIAYGIRAHMSL